MDYLSLLYPFMGAGKSTTATDVLNYFYNPDPTQWSYWAVTNGSLCAFIPVLPTYENPILQKSFKVDGNQFFQVIKSIKAEEIDIALFDTMLRVSALEENNKTEVDFAYITSQNMTDYLMSTFYMMPTETEGKPLSSLFNKALETCLPYITATEGKLSYAYFYGNDCVTANNNSNSEIVVYHAHSPLRDFPFPRMFISKRDGELIAKSKIEWKKIDFCNEQYYRFNGFSDKYKTELIVFTNALNSKENYPVIIDKERYTEKQLNESAAYTIDALEKQTRAEQIAFNKKELESLLTAVTVNGVDPVYSTLSIQGNSIKYEVKYLHLKKSKTIKTSENYPEINIKINPSTLKNILDIDAEYISIDRTKVVCKNDKLTYICFLGD